MGITYAQVRDSIAIARSHGEKFFEQIVWQVENETWTVLGYSSWDQMREGEYADLGVVAPQSDRPELVARLREQGLTQKAIGDTLGVSESTVRNLNRNSADEPAAITNSRGQQRPASYQRSDPAPTPDPPKPARRRPLPDQAREAGWDLRRASDRVRRIVEDDRFTQNREQVTPHVRGHLLHTIEVCQDLINQLDNEGQ